MCAKRKKSSSGTTIVVNQNLMIDNIKEMYEQLQSALDKEQEIVIKSEMVENIDLAGIQLLLYGKQMAKKGNVNLNLDITYADSAKELIVKSGFSSLIE